MNNTTATTDPRRRRPLSIAILAVFMVLYGLFALFPKVLLLTSQQVYDAAADLTTTMTAGGLLTLPLGLQIAISFAASLVVILTGVFVWHGRNWARWVVALWMIITLALNFLQTGITWLPVIKLPLFALVLFLLFRPPAEEYFH